MAAFVRSSTDQTDVHFICQAAHVLLATLGARIWLEWIDSVSNPSDGLSRLGPADPWTAQQGWEVKEYSFPPCLDQENLFQQLEAFALQCDSGWF